MTDPKTLTEAVNLGKGYGIDTAETILALAIARTLEVHYSRLPAEVLSDLRKEFLTLAEEYKSQLTKPVTEEEKSKLTES